MTLWEQEIEKIKASYPKFQVKLFEKSWFFRLLMKFNWKMGATTMYNTVYIEDAQWGTDRGAQTLAHEAAHVADQHRWSILFFISYFLLPIGPSLKAVWEWRGFREDLRWVREHNPPGQRRDYLEKYTTGWIADQFCGINYVWMWPFRSTVEGWCTKFLEGLPK